ncbi:hypothetical protein GQ53DRAFT_741971 [Thozetella sp. PMI_491]|nr:hypothetical protein GQ53DRAFT_741971 [Thozetella sp. PMI_491]
MKFFVPVALASFLGAISLAAAKLPVSVVYQFPNVGSWVENIAVRPNGHLLVTRTDTPELWEIDPETAAASLLHTFPNVTGLTGIAKVGPDAYAVAGLGVDLQTLGTTPETGAVWRISYCRTKVGTKPAISFVTRIPESGFLNGMAALGSKYVLIADSQEGVIWRVDVFTGAYVVAADDPALKIATSAAIPLGVNGVKVLRNYLYFTSTSQQIFGRFPIDADGKPTSAAEVVAEGFLQDDFSLAEDSTAYIQTDPLNTVVEVTSGGVVSTIAGALSSLEFAGATASAWDNDQVGKVLYVTATGGLASPVNGTAVEPGKILKLTLSENSCDST